MKKELIEKLEQLCEDESVVQVPDLISLFQTKLKDIQFLTTKYQLLKFSAELSQAISLYLMTHHYQAPKSVIDFGVWIARTSYEYRGQLSFWQMLALSLSGMIK
ncbi:bacteriocin immunity protein [Streptococcus ruminantium]|nr:bacteriocin immunity protein [Streptococcus ruminantium]MDQ8767691.1 bacteriocin immunity protein [Streptococcus ruminantium]MDQ8779694.1 bacteriocin immunity protein [Streptococcus ruminantium]